MKRWSWILVVASCAETQSSPPAPTPAPLPADPPSTIVEEPAPVDAGVDSPVEPPEEEPIAPSVPGLIPMYQVEPGEDAHEECGAYTVDTLVDASYLTRVEIRDKNGKLVKKLAPQNPMEHYQPVWCFDATGDGTPELVVTHSSGGAHCCYTHTLFSLGPQLKTLLTYAAGNGSIERLTPTDLDGKPPWELLDTDDLLTQHGSTAYAFTRFLPVVFVFEKGRYLKATRRFSSYLEKERNQALTELSACAPGCWTDGEGEYVLGLSLLIGDWDRLKKAEGLAGATLAHLETLRQKIARELTR